MDDQDSQARLAICVLLRKDDKIAFVLRAGERWMSGHYGIVGGRVEPGETFSQAAQREAKEEAGVAIAADKLKPVLTMHRQQRGDNKNHWVDLFFEATEWEGEAYNAEPEVHSELTWFSADNPPANTVPMVAYALKQIAAGKTYVEFGWDD